MLSKERLQTIKYSISIACFIAAYFNFVEYIDRGDGIMPLLFYSGTLFVMGVLLSFVPGRTVLTAIFVIAGILMLYDSTEPKQVNGGVVMFLFASQLYRSVYFRFTLYSILICAVSYRHIIENFSATSILNNLVAYIIFFIINEMMYNKGKESSNDH